MNDRKLIRDQNNRTKMTYDSRRAGLSPERLVVEVIFPPCKKETYNTQQ